MGMVTLLIFLGNARILLLGLCPTYASRSSLWFASGECHDDSDASVTPWWHHLHYERKDQNGKSGFGAARSTPAMGSSTTLSSEFH